MKKEDAKMRIEEIEAAMLQSDFWNDSQKAQALIKEMKDLQSVAEGGSKYDSGSAVVTILAGAGGDDAEDFAGMLFTMYRNYAENKGWQTSVLDDNENDHGGYRSVTFEVSGKNVYKRLKTEAGVHRLVRISPFNAQDKRQTSFALVEILPDVTDDDITELNEDDLETSFTKSGGAGGQNVNKRETAVRITHTPTGLSVHVSSQRSQQANRDRAMKLLSAKVMRRQEEENEAERDGLSIAGKTANEWGSQIRSYILHPYKLVKDHRINYEDRDVEGILGGNLDTLIDKCQEE